jgi:hypothetical protein
LSKRVNKNDMSLYVVLLHADMVDKTGVLVTTSLTLIDLHDIARSAKTYGVVSTYIAHPAGPLRSLARTLKMHWEEGFGATYNPNRKEALEHIRVVSSLDEAISDIHNQTGELPVLLATSAKGGGERISFKKMRESLSQSTRPHLLMLGTGWGMSQSLLDRADLFLEPINGPTPYNHLSVRSACAIMLDRLLGV